MNNEQVVKALRLMVVWSSVIGIIGIPTAYCLGRNSMQNKFGDMSAKLIKDLYEKGMIKFADPNTGYDLSPEESEYVLNELIRYYTT